MGQHKRNQTAILAGQGKIMPKSKKMSKRERDRMMYAKLISCLPPEVRQFM